MEVQVEEAVKRLWAVKGALYNFWISSCTSGKKGTGAGRFCETKTNHTTMSVPLKPDARSGPGKHRRQLWV